MFHNMNDNKNINIIERKKRGSAILLTLVITMIVLTTAIVLGTIIVSSIRRTQLQATSHAAYYAAESMTERALYKLRKEKTLPKDLTFTCDAATLPGIDASLACTGARTHNKLGGVLRLKKNQSVQVKLVDPQAATIKAGIKKVEVTCTDGNPGGTIPWIEITAHKIGTTSWGPPATNPSTKRLFQSCPSLFSVNKLTMDGLDPEVSYVIQITALYDDLAGVKLVAKNEQNQDAELGENFTLTARADYSIFAGQEITVDVSEISTLSGLFDYVLFSEKTITKDVVPGST